MTLTIAVLVVGLLVGAGAGYYMAPSGDDGGGGGVTVIQNPLEGKTIKIGDVVASTAALETSVPLFEEIIAVDINDFFSKMNYDVDVEFLQDTADGQAAIHLEKVQSFKSMDVSIFIGGGWSSQAQAALSYVNDNDMLMISSSSTSPLLSIADDRLFRTCPTDYVQGPAISNMWKSWGVDAIMIFQRGDSWADGIYNVLLPELEKEGIEVVERVRYAAEVTEFSSYLATMDRLLEDALAEYGEGRVGIQTISFDEQVVMMSQTVDYPSVRACIFMGTESSGRSQRMMDDAGGLQNAVGGFSSLMTPAMSWKWMSLDERYFDLVAQPASFYTSTDYDAAYALALSVIEAGSVDANDVAPLWPTVPNNYYGTGGWVQLDENGDRAAGVFDIWGFSAETDVGFTSYGQYSGIDLSVTWDDAALVANGFTRPGPR
jgi:branched-chain amino acid transport system substrate-binding protein